MKISRIFAVAVAVTVITGSAYAQTTYRCKTPSGGTVFSDAPCFGGARQESVVTGSTSSVNRTVDSGNFGGSSNANLLDAKVAEAIGSGDMTRARTLALTPQHWQMISDAEQRKSATVTGRTSADLRAEARNSSECKDAERSYDNDASSILQNGAQIDAAKRRMYSACGMDEPVNVNVDNRTTIRRTTIHNTNISPR